MSDAERLAVREDMPLSSMSSMQVGGPARYFAEATDEKQLIELLEWADRGRVPVRILGGGSNVVISDAGIDGLVIRMSLKGISGQRAGDTLRVSVAAGENWDEFVARMVDEQYAGLECLSGIPGSVGATPIQNVGAYGQDVGAVIDSVTVLDRQTKQTLTIDHDRCRFGYRDSLFKSGQPERFIVLAVQFRLRSGAPPELRYPELARAIPGANPPLSQVRATVLELRRSKSMLLDHRDENGRSCGSFFVNPTLEPDQVADVRARFPTSAMPEYPQPDGRIKLSAAWLIERAGLPKGTRRGPVGLSTRHALALVCHEGARASDVVEFARLIRRQVREQTSVQLTPEPVFWGFASLDDGLPDERLA